MIVESMSSPPSHDCDAMQRWILERHRASLWVGENSARPAFREHRRSLRRCNCDRVDWEIIAMQFRSSRLPKCLQPDTIRPYAHGGQ